MANMTFEEVDVEAVAELSVEEVEEREVFEQEEKGEVEGVLDFFMGGGQSRVDQSTKLSCKVNVNMSGWSSKIFKDPIWRTRSVPACRR